MGFLGSLFYPLVLFGSVVLSLLMIHADWNEMVITIGVPVVTGILVMTVQYFWPYLEKWRVGSKEVNVDILHLLLTALVFPPVCQAVFFGGVAWLSVQVSEWLGSGLWPTSWPFFLQLLLALVIGDFGFYWGHRFLHTKWGWRIHAVHHSSEKLYFFSATRMHPLNFLITYLAPFVPLVVLGAGEEVLLLFSVFTAVHGGLQHANVRGRLGVWNWILATSDLHRWHHSTVMDESNTNFSSNLILWDIVFGTRFLPEDRVATDVGVSELDLPQNYWDHLASPFLWDRYQKDEQAV